MDLQVSEQIIVIVPALWVLGTFLKKTPNVPDWTIPYALLVLGVVGSVLTMGLTVDGIANGIIAVGIAVLGNQVLKQTVNKG